MIYLSLFITFFKIGLFGFGGGYGMLSLIQHETVESHHWLSTAEFTDIVAISQMTPGPIGINSATYCGYTAIENAGYGNMMAVLGSITATSALVLPSLILMILIAKMFMKYMHHHSVESVFRGLRPAVVALIAAPVFRMAKSTKINRYNVWIPVLAALAIWLMGVSPVYIILIAGIGGYTYGQYFREN